VVLRLLVPVAFALAQVSASTPPLPPPGTLVDLGGWRLHLYCTGPTDPVRPTVVLEADAGEFSVDWSLVQPEVARFARVCSYDRAGQGWSEPGPVPRTYRQEVWELRALLERGGVKPPFLLVGNFRTGLNARLFAFTHPDELAGLILVNSSYETDSLAGQNGRLVRVVDMATAAAVPAPRTSGPSRENDLVGEARDRAEDMARRMAPLASAAPYDRLPPDA
jgi:pimeloyl-ACP methyl ester carboxylesterase